MFRLILIFFLLLSESVKAHTFTGMIGFYDGISHPVLGLDHFLAMVSVGIISAQIGGRYIWIIPSVFVIMMIFGGVIGMVLEINQMLFTNYIIENISTFIETGIYLSLILLGLTIAIEKKISLNLIILFISIFGLCHGAAHGLEIPWAANPILFGLGFATGTSTLHLFGVGIGIFSIQNKYSYSLLRLSGACCALYGTYLIFLFF